MSCAINRYYLNSVLKKEPVEFYSRKRLVYLDKGLNEYTGLTLRRLLRAKKLGYTVTKKIFD